MLFWTLILQLKRFLLELRFCSSRRLVTVIRWILKWPSQVLFSSILSLAILLNTILETQQYPQKPKLSGNWDYCWILQLIAILLSHLTFEWMMYQQALLIKFKHASKKDSQRASASFNCQNDNGKRLKLRKKTAF